MFPTTQWTMLAEATRSGDAGGREALNAFCAAYRAPVVAFLRGRGYAEPDAEDMAQEFFASLLASRAWRRAERERGKFRTFLLGALRHVELHAREKRDALKRGGGAMIESLDAWCEDGHEPPAPAADVETFDREWATALVVRAVDLLAGEFEAEGAAREFDELRLFLPGAWTPPTYEAAAERLGRSVTSMKSAVMRMRGRFREHLRAAVAATVGGPHEVDAEMAYLRTLLAAG